MALPYANSKAKPGRAQARIENDLMKFGVQAVSFEKDFSLKIIRVRFLHKDLPVCIELDYGELAKLYMEDTPYSYRGNSTRQKWEEKKQDIAFRASYSILEDHLKSLMVMVRLNVFTFEEAFLSHFMTPSGETVGKRLIPNLKEISRGRLMLPSGDDQ